MQTELYGFRILSGLVSPPANPTGRRRCPERKHRKAFTIIDSRASPTDALFKKTQRFDAQIETWKNKIAVFQIRTFSPRTEMYHTGFVVPVIPFLNNDGIVD
jgi:hypothetical protein